MTGYSFSRSAEEATGGVSKDFIGAPNLANLNIAKQINTGKDKTEGRDWHWYLTASKNWFLEQFNDYEAEPTPAY